LLLSGIFKWAGALRLGLRDSAGDGALLRIEVLGRIVLQVEAPNRVQVVVLLDWVQLDQIRLQLLVAVGHLQSVV